jgi:hypothetical protein
MRTPTIVALGLLLTIGPSRAFAQDTSSHETHEGTSATPAPSGSDQPTEKGASHPMGPGGMGHGGMGMGMKEMHAHMQAMKEHSKMMEGITDQKKLDTEMKKHMRMMDDMMESMMKHEQHETPGVPPAGAKP